MSSFLVQEPPLQTETSVSACITHWVAAEKDILKVRKEKTAHKYGIQQTKQGFGAQCSLLYLTSKLITITLTMTKKF